MDIEFKEGAVCFANGECHYQSRAGFVEDSKGFTNSFSGIMNFSDFKLNTINQGDYIEALELDGKKDFSNTIKVFELFGFAPYLNCDMDISEFILTSIDSGLGFIADSDDDLVIDYDSELDKTQKKRKLTYPQVMAIGELKRLELAKSAPKIAPDLTPGLVSSQEVKMQKNKPVVAQVMIDLTERMEIGIKTYGEALRANNGRDALQDAYEEALDLACYLKQAMIERDNANTN